VHIEYGSCGGRDMFGTCIVHACMCSGKCLLCLLTSQTALAHPSRAEDDDMIFSPTKTVTVSMRQGPSKTITDLG